MKEVLLSQIDEMLHNVIEAEHQGTIKITDVEMEDSAYSFEDKERYLSITIEYVPVEMITMSDKEQEEPSVNLKINNIQEYNQKLDVIAGRAKILAEAIDDINNTELDVSVEWE